MTAAQAQSRHAELVAELRRHDHSYYVLAKPEISDREYDKLYQELLDLEKQLPELVTPDSPSQRVAGAPTEGFKRITHLQPMLSLEKIEAAEQPDEKAEPDWFKRSCAQDENTLAKLLAWDATIRKHVGRDKVEYVMEPKVDGVSIGVHYRHGKLALGVTRGDGQTGDDITVNLRTVKAIPLELGGTRSTASQTSKNRDAVEDVPPLLEVRGEAYMTIDEFEKLNKKLEAAGEKTLPNPRNATAGTLKQLDPRLVAQRPVRAVFYAVGACDGIEFESHAEMLESLTKFGLPTQKNWWLCKDMEEVIATYRQKVVAGYDEDRDLRKQVPYDIDGVVIKVNRIADWARIPAKTRAPGYAIVHKPIPWITPAETVLKAITVQVGRTGVLTPVAELEPVFVQGSTISRATLHNEDEIRRKDIRIGDTVVIRKAGMVIPEVFEVVKTKRPPGAKEFDLFKHIGGKCPACGGAIAKDKIKTSRASTLPLTPSLSPTGGEGGRRPGEGETEEVAWRCQNVAGCPAQLTRRVEYFAYRKSLDIESLGGIVAEKLVERGLVKEPLDLFDLKLDQLGKLNLGTDDEPRVFGEKNATKIIEALGRSKAYPLARWLLALGIAGVGEATAFYIGKWHRDFDDVANSNLLKLICEEGKLRSRESAENSEDESKEQTLIARRRSVWETIRQEIDRRTRTAKSLRDEVEAERTRISHEIEEVTSKKEDLDKKAAAHKDEQKKKQHDHREKLPAELKKEREKVKGRLLTLEERLFKAGMPEELGPVVAESMLEFFASKTGKKTLSRLRELAIWPPGGLAHAKTEKANALAGKTFVLTGALPTLSRDEASALIREAGGNVSGSVSKNTDYLLAGESPGSKLDKAKELGLKIISEDEFRALLGTASTSKKQDGKKQSELF